MSGIDFTFVKRTDKDGNPSIAPFIGNRNVWDINPKNWTRDVQKAIMSAYLIGVIVAEERMSEAVFDKEYILHREWKDVDE